MPFLTAPQISGLAVALLTRSIVLPQTVTRIPGGDFRGDNGDTITVRVRLPRTAKKQVNPGDSITIDSITEVPVNVSLSHLYDAVNINDQDLSLNLVDFGRQVLEPQTRAVAIGGETELSTVMNNLVADTNLDMSPASGTVAEETDRVLKLARETLSKADVPPGDRFLACAPDFTTLLLGVDKFVRADALGDGASSAIRQARMGSIYGFTVVESNALDPLSAVAYHRSGFVFATRTPVVPRGVTFSSTATEDGIGIRYIQQYQPSNLRDQSVLTTFAGAGLVDNDRVFAIQAVA